VSSPSDLARKREDYSRRQREAVDKLRQVLCAMPNVVRVSLFGSYARGRSDLFTDLDVLVIMETDEPFVERLPRLYGMLALPVDMDLVCYTPAEFEALREGAFLKHALRDEIVLYEKKPA
jgi:predicted nucleotidyltransferase